MNVLQLIDEAKQFNPETKEFLSEQNVLSVGLNYHLVAVFGSQSTGKSTLLNALFSTKFGTMDQQNRQQTTKGIWMGIDHNENPLLVLDVEGTDGRERGEDQDFERKSALFALASSEVLIVNMWEHQVGLYQGANMGLLKTVFEVNLGLFQSNGKCPRSRILFVIRDHVGTTPLASLSLTLTDDLNKHWQSIAKPVHLEESKLSDFFDIEFVTLPHKLLQPELFAEQVAELRKSFGGYFKPEYHRNIPIDGWPHYAEQIWQQIELNKDLDLPTQQILVARFRCHEIADAAWAAFTSALATSTQKFGGDTVIDNFGACLKPMRVAALETYDAQASKYAESVYAAERNELLTRLDTLLLAHFKAQLDAVAAQQLAAFKREVAAELANGVVFKDATAASRARSVQQFKEIAQESALDAETFVFEQDIQQFEQRLDDETHEMRAQQQTKLAQRLNKRIYNELADELPSVFRPPSAESWTKALTALNQAIASALAPYAAGKDFGLGGSEKENEAARAAVEFEAWKAFDTQIVELTRPEALVTRLRDFFDDKFQYGKDGAPILWKAGDDIEGAYMRARDETLELLPIFTRATVEPPAHLEILYAQQEYEAPNYARLLPDSRQEQIKQRFLKDASTACLNAKRSVQHTSMHVPLWVWGIIVVLGWNEFMMILRNPLLICLLLILSAGFYLLYTLGLTNQAFSVGQATVRQVQVVAKDKLREWVNDNQTAGSSSSSGSGSEQKHAATGFKERAPAGGELNDDIELDNL